MSRKEDIEKLNSLVAEVNALAEKINKEYEESAAQENNKPDVLADYESAFQIGNVSDVYYLDFNSEINDTCNYGDGLPFSKCGIYASNYYNPYHMYLSEEYAKKAAKMKKFNDILLAFKWCYDRTYEPDWGNSNSLKYSIHYDTDVSMYIVESSYVFAKNDVYFNTPNAAQKCAIWLNKIDPKGELVK